MQTCKRTCMHTNIQTCMHTYRHACILAFIHTDMHTFMHTCIHTCIHSSLQVLLVYHQRCCHVSYLQTYLLRWCCKSTIHNYITSLEGAAISTKRTSFATYLHTYLTKKVLQKNQCITKGAAKSTNRHTAKCICCMGFSCTVSPKLLQKKSGVVLHPYIPTD